MEIKENLKLQISGLTEKQMSILIWLCGVRALPFMSVRSGFCYWYDLYRKKYIDSIFHALDIGTRHVFYGIGDQDEAKLSYSIVMRAAKDITRDSQKAYFSGYTPAVVASEIVEIIADIAIDSYSFSLYFSQDEVIRNKIIDETIHTLNKFINVVEKAKKVILESYNGADDTFGTIRVFDLRFKIEDIIAKDIEMIRDNKIKSISNDTSLYGELWSGFQADLNEIDCDFWAEFYNKLFVNHFVVELYDIEKRLETGRDIVIEELDEKEQDLDEVTDIDDINYRRKSIFLSYCSADSDIIDIIDTKLMNHFNRKVTISRYERNVKYRDSFKVFMNSIKDHDFVVTVISAKYLKSRACMYEVNELISLPDFQNRLLFIVLSDEDKEYYKICPPESIAANIYNPVGRNEYMIYWKNKYEELYAQRNLIGNVTINRDLDVAIYETKKILDNDLQNFLSYIADARGIPFKELLQADFNELVKIVIKD